MPTTPKAAIRAQSHLHAGQVNQGGVCLDYDYAGSHYHNCVPGYARDIFADDWQSNCDLKIFGNCQWADYDGIDYIFNYDPLRIET